MHSSIASPRAKSTRHVLRRTALLLITLLFSTFVTPAPRLAALPYTPRPRIASLSDLAPNANPNIPTASLQAAPDRKYDLQGLQTSKLLPDDLTSYDFFGDSMAISGDTLVVGARDAPALYVFTRELASDTWQQVARINPGSQLDGRSFSVHSVAIDGDLIAVGLIDSTYPYVGTAAVYSRNQGGANTWGLVTTFQPHDATPYTNFGRSVAISGDTIVVGALGDHGGSTYEGAAYVFERDHGGSNQWGETAKLRAADAAGWQYFGSSVAIDGNTIAVGAPRGTSTNSSPGAVYLFERDTSGSSPWRQSARLAASDGSSNDYFGGVLALSGDTLAVAASATQAVYLHDRNSDGMGAWGEIKRLTTSDVPGDHGFGSAIALRGTRLVIGASLFGQYYQSGVAYVYDRDFGGAGQWGVRARLLPQNEVIYGSFGNAVAFRDDMIVVAAFTDGDHWTDSGSAFVFRLYPRPQALDDVATTDEDTPAIIDVLANDSTAAGTGSLEPSSVKVVTLPAQGSASVDPSSGAITYTPKPNFHGVDQLTYSVANTAGASQTAAVTVTVRSVNDAPRFVSTPRTAAVAYTPYRYDIIAQDSDTGDTLTISAPNKPTWLTLAATGNGTTILTGTADYTLVGEHLIDLQVADTGGLTATQTFTLTVEPAIPAPPTTLIAWPISASAIKLSWRDASSDERGFSIERRSGAEPWVQVATVGAGATTYVDQGLECGLVYDYRVSAFNQHWPSDPSNTASIAPSELTPRSFNFVGTPAPIAAAGRATASITIADSGVIADLDVRVEIDHIYDGDLLLTLTAPDRTTVLLSAYNGEPGRDYLGTIFDDEATTPITNGYAPFSGRYRPQGSLGTLYGKPLAGTWTLTVQNGGSFVGVVTDFGLDIAATSGCPGAPPTPTSTPSPTSTAGPTPSPTSTATPTSTPTPSATPVAPLPMVVTINSSPDTGDGALSEGEVARVALAYLSVTFNTDITYFKRRAFLLLAEGAQPGFQTTSCARPDPSDQRFFSNFQSFSFPSRRITLGFSTPEGSVLPNGRYRFIVCDTATSTYPLLDGDSDGIAGGDFVRHFSVDRPVPTSTPTPTTTATPTATATSTATATPTTTPTTKPTSTATATVTPAGPTSTPTSTPRSLPQLSINYLVGRPGSTFTVTGSAFPPNAQAFVAVNEVEIGRITTDNMGALRLFLETSTLAAPGFYEVTVTVASDTRGIRRNNQSAKVSYMLGMDSDLRTDEPDETTVTLAVSTDIQPQGSFRIYIPLVEVLSDR